MKLLWRKKPGRTEWIMVLSLLSGPAMMIILISGWFIAGKWSKTLASVSVMLLPGSAGVLLAWQFAYRLPRRTRAIRMRSAMPDKMFLDGLKVPVMVDSGAYDIAIAVRAAVARLLDIDSELVYPTDTSESLKVLIPLQAPIATEFADYFAEAMGISEPAERHALRHDIVARVAEREDTIRGLVDRMCSEVWKLGIEDGEAPR